jgi:hypothetical protein
MLNARQTNPTDYLIQSAAALARDDLLELKAAIDALVIATEPPPKIIDLDDARDRLRPESKAKRSAGGWIEITYKTSKGKRYGPFRYLRWRQGSIKKSKYLGKVPSNDAT